MTAAITEIERPQRVYAEFWPATVLMPDGSTRRKVRVYLTDTGAHLFFTKPTNELAPGFSARIDYSSTEPPNLHAFNVGVDIVLLLPVTSEQGDVDLSPALLVVTPTDGCGCGTPLRSWRPSWSHEISPWPKP